MLLVKYKLQDFIIGFDNKLRKETDLDEQFNTIKKELNIHLKKFNASLENLEELEIYKVGHMLRFEFLEETEQPMKINLLWRVNELTEEDLKDHVRSFSMDNLGLKGEQVPSLQLVSSDMRNSYALYWPDVGNIVISKFTVNQLDKDLIFSILRHEVIHHYLVINDKNASDTSPEFIKLIKEHDAYVSQEENAKKSFEESLEK